ncbi:MAG TPA: restriction endonuclease subunit S [Nitrospira sp.]|nr:restriction endonuclease subunit S [Nitrospira sp.]
MTDAIDLTTEQRKTLNDLLRRFLPGVAVWAYGSRVKWTARPNSDLDLVAFTTPAQLPQVVELKDALAESNLPFPVDLHVWDDVPERFREIIRKEYVVVQEAKELGRGSGGLSMVGESSVVHIPSTAVLLPSDWRWERLDEVCDGVFDCPHSTPVLTADGPFVVRSQDMRTGVFRMEEAAHVSEDTYQERIVRAEPRYGDLLYSREGTYFGIAAEVPTGIRVCLGQRMVLVRPKVSKCSHRFLRYWLNSPVMASHTHGHRDGTVAERLNLPTIRQLPVAVPPLDEQRAIARILGTLDDKIELSRRMNETLEAMARTLFKSWFVDFDPVRAKAEGRDTGLPKPVADLFPDSFEDSDLGEIPRGWEVGTLGDFSALNPESWSKDTRPSEIKYVDLSNTKWGRIEQITRFAADDAPSRAQRVLRPRDTIVGTVRPGNGSYAFILVDGLTGSTGFAVLRPRSDKYAEFVYLAATAADNIDALAHLADGGAYPAVRPEVVATTQVARPKDDVLEAFSRATGSMLRKIAGNGHESRTLAALRDMLLPKLISGELRVPEGTIKLGGRA